MTPLTSALFCDVTARGTQAYPQLKYYAGFTQVVAEVQYAPDMYEQLMRIKPAGVWVVGHVVEQFGF